MNESQMVEQGELVAQLRSEVANLKDRLTAAQMSANEWENSYRAIESSETNAPVQPFNAEILKKLTESFGELMAEKKDLLKKLNSRQPLKNDKDVHQVEQENQALKTRVQDKDIMLTDLMLEANRLQKQLQASLDELQELRQKEELLFQEKVKSLGQNAPENAADDTEAQELNAQPQESMMKLEDEKKALVINVSDLAKQLAEKEEVVTELQRELTKVTYELQLISEQKIGLVAQHQKTMTELQEEKSSVEHWKGLVTNYEEALSTTQREFSEYKEEVDTQKGSLEVAEQKNSGVTAEWNRSQEQNQSLKAYNSSLADELEESKLHVNRMMAEVQEITKENQELMEKNGVLSSTHCKMQEMVEKTKDKNDSQVRLISDLKSEIAPLQRSLHETTSERDCLKAEVKQELEEMKNLTSNIETLEAENVQLRSQIYDMEIVMASKEGAISSLVEREQVLCQNMDAEVAAKDALVLEIENMRKQQEAEKEAFATLNQALEKVKVELGQKNKQNSALMETIETNLVTISKFEENLTELRNKNEEDQAYMTQIVQSKTQKLQEEFIQAKQAFIKQLDELKADHENVSKTLTENDTLIRELKQANKELQEQAEQNNSQHLLLQEADRQKIAALYQSLEEKQQQVAHLELKSSEALTAKDQELEELRAKHAFIEAMKNLDDELGQTPAGQNPADSNSATLQSEVLELRVKCRLLQTLLNLRQEVSSVAATGEKIQEVQLLENKVTELLQENVVVADELKRKQGEIEQMQINTQNLKESLQNESTQINAFKEQALQLLEDKEKLLDTEKSNNEKHEKQLQELEEKLVEQEQRITQLKVEVQNAKEQLAQKEDELLQATDKKQTNLAKSELLQTIHKMKTLRNVDTNVEEERTEKNLTEILNIMLNEVDLTQRHVGLLNQKVTFFTQHKEEKLETDQHGALSVSLTGIQQELATVKGERDAMKGLFEEDLELLQRELEEKELERAELERTLQMLEDSNNTRLEYSTTTEHPNQRAGEDMHRLIR